MKNKKCPLGVYCECDCNTCTKEDKKEKLQICIDVVVPVVEELCSVILPVMHDVVKTIYQGWKEVIKTYPYKKVAYLALYHPKKRVRKKNMNRIVKSIISHYKNSPKEFRVTTECEETDSFKILSVDLSKSRDCTANVGRAFSEIYTHEAGGNGEDAE